MKLKFGDDASIAARDAARMEAAGYQLVTKTERRRIWSIERDEKGQPVRMFWHGVEDVTQQIWRKRRKRGSAGDGK